MCTIQTLRRMEGVLKFRNTFTGTLWAFWVSPMALVVQWGIDTTLADDAAGEGVKNSGVERILHS